MRIVFEGRHRLCGVLNKSLLAVKLLQVLIQALAYFFAVGDVALVEPDYRSDLRLREDRVALYLELAQAINLPFNDWNRHAQSFVDRRQKRQRQNGESGTTRTHTLDTRLAVACLQIALRAHVVLDQVQVDVQFLAIEYVSAFETSDQACLFDVLHCAAQLTITENRVAFKFNVNNANSLALVNRKSDGKRGS